MKPDDGEDTQLSRAGEEIPVPKRGDVLRDLRRVARRKPADSDGGGAEDQR